MLRRMIFPALLAGTAPLVTPLAAAADIPAVTADTPIANSFAAMVLGELGTPALLLDRGGDPHHVQLRPSQARAVANADLVIWSGAGLAPWMARVVDTLNDNTALDLSAVDGLHTSPLVRTALFDAHDDSGDGHDHGEHDAHQEHDHEEHDHTMDAHDDHDHGDHDHADAAHEDHDDHNHDHGAHEEGHEGHGHEEHAEEGHADENHDDHGHEADHDHDHDHAHDHGAFDPHLWMTPENAAPFLNAIAARLSTLDPENAGTYFANAAQAIAEIDALSAEIAQTLEPVGDAGLVTYHAAYGYFGEAFDLNLVGTIALGDAADPGAARIVELRAALEGAGALCIFPEVNHSAGYVTIVAEDTDLRIGEPLDPAGVMLDPGPDLYAQTLRGLANTIAQCVVAP